MTGKSCKFNLGAFFWPFSTFSRRTGSLALWISAFIGQVKQLEDAEMWPEIEAQNENFFVNFKTNRHPSAVKFTPIFASISSQISQAKFIEGKSKISHLKILK